MPAQVTVIGPDGVSETIRSLPFPPDVVKAAGEYFRRDDPERLQFSDKAVLDEFLLPTHRGRFKKLQDSGFTLEGSYDVLQSEIDAEGNYWLDPYCVIGMAWGTNWELFVDRMRTFWTKGRAAA